MTLNEAIERLNQYDSWSMKKNPDEKEECRYTVCIEYDGNKHYQQGVTVLVAISNALMFVRFKEQGV